MNQSELPSSTSVDPGHPSFCVVIPTYNNGKTLADVINGVLQHTHDVIVVNDGSDDHTSDILLDFPKIHIVSYDKNRGKGHALKQGFKKALELKFEYAITIDSDGQHDPEDIISFTETLKREGKSLIVGARSLKGLENVPSRNSFANRFSNFWFHLQTGIRLNDTQSGFRLYPLSLFEKRKYVSRKYEFELEVLVRAAWRGINIISIPIYAYYAPLNERVSHFRPFRDFGRISILNFFLTFLAIAYYRPVMIIRKFRKKKLREIIREDLFSGKYSNKKIAASVGFGVFMGILPIWGYQLVVGFIIAHFLKMSKTIFFLAANISLPPMLPFILYLSYVTGSFVMGDFSWKVDFDLTLESIKQNLVQYLIGSVILAVVAGLFFGFLASVIVPFIRNRKQK
jgi:glycosyltransferase involved in cell wall biosynthesis